MEFVVGSGCNGVGLGRIIFSPVKWYYRDSICVAMSAMNVANQDTVDQQSSRDIQNSIFERPSGVNFGTVWRLHYYSSDV